MSVTVSKEVDGKTIEYDIDVHSDSNTAYLRKGETVVSNPNNAKIKYPSKMSSVKSAIVTTLVVGVLLLTIVAFLNK